MPQSEPLLPTVTNTTDYASLRIDPNVWPIAMQAICHRHGLPTDKLVRFGDGTDPAGGSSVVFAPGDHLVIKLFPPYRKSLFEAELTVPDHIYAKLSVSTPERYALNRLDD